MADLAELVIQVPGSADRTIDLDGRSVTVGRASGNVLSFPDDAGLSRQHLTFEATPSGWTVRDLGSKNGTLVNGVRAGGAHALVSGDEIMAGHLVMRFRVREQEKPAEAPVTESKTVVFVAGPISRTASTYSTDLQAVLGEKPSGSVPPQEIPPTKFVQALIRAGQELFSPKPLSELFPLILELSLGAVEAKRGVLMTMEKDSLVVQAAHGENFQISSTVRDRVLKEACSLLVHDAQYDPELAKHHSIMIQGMRSILAVPLQTRDRVIGLIYVDTQDEVRFFSNTDLSLLTVMANVAAIRIEQARLAEIEIQERRTALEMEQAAEIQRGLLPSAPPRVSCLDVAGANVPCLTVGGDYYDYFPLEDGRLGVVVADVAGKGMPAAMMMSNLQAHMQVYAETDPAPARLVTRLNKSVAARCPGNRFITFFYGVIDPKSGTITYCNAGHNPPLLLHVDGTVEQLEGGGIILGVFASAEYDERQVRFGPGDSLVMFSDGVTEACRPGTEEDFGEMRLAQVLAAQPLQSAEGLVRTAMDALQEWTGDESYADDVTLVIARRTH